MPTPIRVPVENWLPKNMTAIIEREKPNIRKILNERAPSSAGEVIRAEQVANLAREQLVFDGTGAFLETSSRFYEAVQDKFAEKINTYFKKTSSQPVECNGEWLDDALGAI